MFTFDWTLYKSAKQPPIASHGKLVSSPIVLMLRMLFSLHLSISLFHFINSHCTGTVLNDSYIPLILMLLHFQLSSLLPRNITLYSYFSVEEISCQNLRVQFRLPVQLCVR